MRPDIHPGITIRRIAFKEAALFFSSPVAYLFLAVFAAITLFVFFWGESFFARNIADVRPLFEWMPILLIFLCSALTMRLWSEERRNGTLEFVLTQTVPLWHFVVGKFVSCLFLLIIALLITVPLPVTVAILANLDWGPVLAAYLATLLMGAAYISIGLFVSARTDNQIVSLMLACVLCGTFYLFGSPVITDLFANQVGDGLRLLGAGSRFESITRGVIDFRDLYYYLSLVLAFLALNTLMLEKERWATRKDCSHHRQWQFMTALVVANALGGNLWLGQLHALRIDVTQGQQYSISDASKTYLTQLQEPLLIKGYFSSKTHPLLSPLVPQLRDLIKEYEIAGGGRVRVEFVDPLTDPKQEEEANQHYGIKPVPFQVADRYQSAIVSSYFNVVIQYGDQHQVLGFNDLIEVRARHETDINVKLRNPEHDLTRAIKKVLNTYQGSGNLFDTIKTPLVFNAYISSDTKLPAQLITFKASIKASVDKLASQSQQRLTVNFIEPEADNGEMAKKLAEQYGFKPMTANLFDTHSFYFYLTLQGGNQVVQIPHGNLNGNDFDRNLDAAIKRFATGFTKTVALVTPKAATPASPYMPQQPVAGFRQLSAFLEAELNLIEPDLSLGEIPGEADILVLAAPSDLSQEALFAVDQFLMKGGTVILATSPYHAQLSNQGITLKKQTSGLEDWLSHHGLTVQASLVLDQQNASFPIPVMRNLGGFRVQEMRMIDYPYFTDIRHQGLNQDNLITADIPQVTMTWGSPVKVDTDKQKGRQVTELLTSSSNAWLSESTHIMPTITPRGVSEFRPEGEKKSHVLGVMSQGRFESYFSDQSSPLLTDKPVSPDGTLADEAGRLKLGTVISHSTASARIILFASNSFFEDQILRMTSAAHQSSYLNSIQLIANAIDWSLEDSGLLSIRSRGNFNRTLPPMAQSRQMIWEYMNYSFAALAILMVGLVERRRRHVKQKRHKRIMAH